MDIQAVEPSMGDLRAMLSSDPAPAAEPVEPTTSEPVAEAAVSTEPATEPGEPKTEPAKTDDEPLPEGVQKRIAKEAEKAARIQSEIDRAVSARKAKEAELQRLSTDEKGSEPVKTPQSSTEKPKRPTLCEAGHENETWEQFQTRESAYEDARESWIKAEALREFKQQTAAEQQQAKAQERWNAAVEKHGAEFPALMESARQLAPEGLQAAISGLEHWSDVAVHLAKNQAQLQELAAKYQQNPYAAIATLGRIEAALTSRQEPKPVTAPLPEPIKPVGGSASASGQTLQDGLEKGSMSSFKALVKKTTGR